ncbi:MAG: PAS domain S-box protein, partial [Desulfobacterales bacterium]|nr:PAS domain S-box protein [Desulfobacterales bacterium]
FLPAWAGEKVVLQLRWDHQFQFAGYYAAKWQGYYENVGLDVEIRSAVTREAIRSAVSEVAEGRADFGIGAADILKARDSGAPLVVVAAIFQQSAAAFYTRKETVIHSPGDFLRLRVARRPNDLIDIEFQAMLKAEGFDPEHIEPYPHQPGLAHLISGKVDVAPGYAINIPFTAKTNGVELNEIRPVQYGIDFYGDALFTRQDIIDRSPDLVARFKAASIKGWEYALENSDTMVGRIVEELNRIKTVDDLAQLNRYQSQGVSKLTHYPVVELGHINPDRWAKMHHFLKRIGLVKNPLDIDALIFDPERTARLAAEKRQKQILYGLGMIAAVSCLGLLWILVLRRAVRMKTKDLTSANQLLKKNERYLNNIFEAAQNVAFVITDLGGRETKILDMSPGAETIFQVSKPEAVGRKVAVFHPSEDVEHFPAMQKKLAESGIGFSGETTLVRKSGDTFPALFSLFPRYGEDGNLIGTLGVSIDISKQKKEEEKYRKTIDGSIDGFLSVDIRGQILEVNSAYCRLTGYEPSALKRMKIADVEALERPDDVEERIKKIIVQGTDKFETRHRCKDGSIIELEVSTVFDRSGDGVFYSFIRDITARKLREAALRASEEKFANIYHQSPMLISISTIEEGRYIDVNESFCRLTGYAREEVIGSRSVDLGLISSEDRRIIFSRVTRQKAISDHEVRLTKKGGSTFHGLLSCVPIRYEGNDHLLSIINDISERKRVEEELLEHREEEKKLTQRLQSLWHIASMGGESIQRICNYALAEIEKITQSQYSFLGFLNDAQTEMTIHSWSTEAMADCEITDKPLTFPIKTAGIWASSVRDRAPLIINDYKAGHNDKLGLPEGHVPITRTLSVPVIEDDRVVAVAAVANKKTAYTEDDATQIDAFVKNVMILVRRKETDEEKHELEKQLRQLQKNEAIGTLAGGIAHDFNNILFPIVGFAEMMADDLPENSPFHTYLNEILSGAKRATDLVRQILTFARQTEEEHVPLQPHLIINEVLKLIRSTLPSNINITHAIAKDCGLICADATHIHQVSMNLLTNAYHSMASDGGSLRVTLSSVEKDELPPGLSLEDKPHVKLTVSDTGCGMNRETLEKIFDPYFSTKPKDKGTGLGLSVVKGIVLKYGGDIEVESVPGEGSEFKVYFPVIQADVSLSDVENEPAVIGGEERILLVDDEKPVLKLQNQMLTRLGYAVQAVNSSTEALEMFLGAPDQFDLIITDMTMPQMTGDRLTLRVREGGYPVPIIICTGYSERISVDQAKAIGANGLVFKPVVKTRLADMVRQALDQSAREDENQAWID